MTREAILEGILFAMGGSVEREQLAEAMEITPEEVEEAAAALKAKYEEEERGIRLIRLCNRYDQMRKPGRGLVLPEVGDFITLIRDAEYVLTDSFHCTSFSILFHKQFASFLPSRFGSRVTNVLEMTGLEERLITDFSDFETLDRPIDYTGADRILNEKRAQGRRFLAGAIGAPADGD